MTDPEKVVIQVEQGNCPSNWRVYRVSYKNNSVIAHWVFVGLIGIISLYLLSVTITGFFILLSLLAVSIWEAIRVTHKANTDKRFSILAILPVGVVQHLGYYDLKKIGWLYFPNIVRIELAQETEIRGFDGDVETRTAYWLDVYCTDGAYRKWGINECFGDTASIGKSIIAAFNHYQHDLSNTRIFEE